MTASVRPAARARDPSGEVPAGDRAGGDRPLVVTGAIAACAAVAAGLAVLTPLVLIGWIAAPHAGAGLLGVLRTATDLWLAAHHVGFALRGAGRIGMLPLGLVVLPGAVLWRAGKWVARRAEVSRLRHVAAATLALAVPYALLAGALALAGRSSLASPSLPEAVVAAFLLALVAGGIGGARVLAPWGRLAGLLPPRARSVVVGTAGALAVLVAAGAILAGASLALHMRQFSALNASLGAGVVGSALLLLAQIAYVPNAVVWAICYTLGPGFAFGVGTVVAPTGSALGPLPTFPMLAALPGGAHTGTPLWASAALLAVPYLAGGYGGVLTVRTAFAPAAEVAPLWGFASGAAAGCVTGVVAAFAGGPLGSGRLAAVGPSGWQAALVATLEVGVAAAVAAGVASWLRTRALAAAHAAGPEASSLSADPGAADTAFPAGTGDSVPDESGHRIYVDPWGNGADPEGGASGPGPASLP